MFPHKYFCVLVSVIKDCYAIRSTFCFPINIDYSYLWDFICKPNNKNNAGVLFDKGINLVIFNSPQDDVTDKIEIICPKQTFTSEIFSEMKQTVMLYKEGVFFEPLVLFNNQKDTIKMRFNYDELNKSA